MNASSIRRFLQAPDQLRFPIAAPALIGALWLFIAMAFGFEFGFQVRGDGHGLQRAYQITTLAHEQAEGRSGHVAYLAALTLDDVVHRLSRKEDARRASYWKGIVSGIPFIARQHERDRVNVARLAEERLKYYSGDSPLWKATASLCAERAERAIRWNGKPTAFDYIASNRQTAADYSRLLGREVRPADLAPLVPGGRCD